MPARVTVAMSGGVDSSVAAALLLEQGFQVDGVMLHLWAEPGARENACCSLQAQSDAAEVARILSIPFRVLDASEIFRRKVVEPFIDTYIKGRTPNPCIICNREIRFGFLLEYALKHGSEFMATGHYARIRHTPEGTFQLLKGKDTNKDQSYVLYTLTQEKLAHILFPVGDYTKPQVRKIAREHNLPVTQKPESQDLCFAAGGDYRGFLKRHSPHPLRPGPIMDTRGNVLGQHHGLALYTIGQRKGLGIAAGEPLYVVAMDADRNALIVGTRKALGKKHLSASDVNWISGKAPESAIEVDVKIRYRATPVPATVVPIPGNEVTVSFHSELRDITPGQSAVFYQDDVCLGGGIIRG